jgi:hypothetical protein
MSREPDPRDQWAVGSVGQSSYGRVFRTERGWVFDDDSGYDAAEDISNFRPLVVIDPEDREAVERLTNALKLYRLKNLECDADNQEVIDTQAALREYANPKPPKPDEPRGLGAVVEDEDGVKWVRNHGSLAPWLRTIGDTERPWRYYADIAAVRVLSPGVEVDQ